LLLCGAIRQVLDGSLPNHPHHGHIGEVIEALCRSSRAGSWRRSRGC
jgi:hypothetical protein